MCLALMCIFDKNAMAWPAPASLFSTVLNCVRAPDKYFRINLQHGRKKGKSISNDGNKRKQQRTSITEVTQSSTFEQKGTTVVPRTTTIVYCTLDYLATEETTA